MCIYCVLQSGIMEKNQTLLNRARVSACLCVRERIRQAKGAVFYSGERWRELAIYREGKEKEANLIFA